MNTDKNTTKMLALHGAGFWFIQSVGYAKHLEKEYTESTALFLCVCRYNSWYKY